MLLPSFFVFQFFLFHLSFQNCPLVTLIWAVKNALAWRKREDNLLKIHYLIWGQEYFIIIFIFNFEECYLTLLSNNFVSLQFYLLIVPTTKQTGLVGVVLRRCQILKRQIEIIWLSTGYSLLYLTSKEPNIKVLSLKKLCWRILPCLIAIYEIASFERKLLIA
jgi:hypothetical protein